MGWNAVRSARFEILDRQESPTLSSDAASLPSSADISAIMRVHVVSHAVILEECDRGSLRLVREISNARKYVVSSPALVAENIAEIGREKPERLSEILQTLHDWGYTMPSLRDDEVESSRIAFSGEYADELIQVCAIVSSAQFPFASGFINRFDEAFNSPMTDGTIAASFWMAQDFRSMLMEGFGFYRKDLAKLVLSSPPYITNWLSLFAPYLTQDQVVRAFSYMVEHERFPIQGMDSGTAHDVMESILHPTSRFNLAVNKDEWDEDMDFYEDLISVSELDGTRVICDTKLQGWGEINRSILANYAQNNPDARGNEWSRDVPVDSIPGYTIRPLITAESLVFTGKKMSVCVGSMPYWNGVTQGSKTLIRLDDEGGPKVLLDFEQEDDVWRIQEARGCHNSKAPSDIDYARLTKLVNVAYKQFNESAREGNDRLT